MRPLVKSYSWFLMRIATGLILVCLLLSLTACAAAPVSAVRCDHPLIDPTTHGGLTRAVNAYAEAVDLCNALNGFPLED